MLPSHTDQQWGVGWGEVRNVSCWLLSNHFPLSLPFLSTSQTVCISQTFTQHSPHLGQSQIPHEALKLQKQPGLCPHSSGLCHPPHGAKRPVWAHDLSQAVSLELHIPLSADNIIELSHRYLKFKMAPSSLHRLSTPPNKRLSGVNKTDFPVWTLFLVVTTLIRAVFSPLRLNSSKQTIVLLPKTCFHSHVHQALSSLLLSPYETGSNCPPLTQHPYNPYFPGYHSNLIKTQICSQPAFFPGSPCVQGLKVWVVNMS